MKARVRQVFSKNLSTNRVNVNRKRGEVILAILGCDGAVVSFCVEYECSFLVLVVWK